MNATTTLANVDVLVPIATTVVGGLLTAATTLLVTSGERSLRRRLARDVETWEKLPAGSQPRAEMFHLIGQQVDALVRPDGREASLRNRSRSLIVLALVLACTGLGGAIEWSETPDRWTFKVSVAEVTVAIMLALWAAGIALQAYLVRRQRRRVGA